MKRPLYLLIPALILLFSCNCEEKRQTEAQAFLDEYTTEFQQLYTASSEAEWKSNTYIVDGDTATTNATNRANEALARFTGSADVISKTRNHLKWAEFLTPLQNKQLNRILYSAANNPATVEELVSKRIAAETRQTEMLYGFNFQIDGKDVSTNDIDEILRTEKKVGDRLKAWEASKEVGKSLKTGLTNLRNLRNETVQALGYPDYYNYQVSDYGMTVAEMREMMDNNIREIWPLYRELHTWARYELAKQYNEPVPEMLPAHWLPNRWGQDWQSLVEVEGINLDDTLKAKGSEWLIKQAERFYVSVGFEPLPEIFWEKSSLYPAPAGAEWKKNNHASAWHVDLDRNVRCLQSLVPNSDWYETTHHELGHIYYFLEYSNDSVPVLLREGANRAYHEAMGSLLGLAAMQKPFMEGLNLIPKGVQTDETQILLKEALNYVVFIPFSSGVMAGFEHDLYVENLPEEQFNERWWEYKKKYQGIVPPTNRGSEYCDAASKTHINNDAAQYYDYAISYILLFQLHDHIATKILKQDPRATNYYGNKEVGNFLKSVMRPGATGDWRELLKKATGEDLSARAMLQYFEPLMAYLKDQNQGRVHTLPETI
ncbi:MAG: M2 family metallopeptidase [Bacteroidia bacterium]|nr:M2 family metallopeptidase [Bacteroidia bacterium]